MRQIQVQGVDVGDTETTCRKVGMWDREEKAAIEDCVLQEALAVGHWSVPAGKLCVSLIPAKGPGSQSTYTPARHCRGMPSGALIPRCFQPVLCKGRVAE